MRKLTDFEQKTLKTHNCTLHGRATDYSYKFQYRQYAKWRNTTEIDGEITGAGKNALRVVLTASTPKITGRKLGQPVERVIFDRVIKYWDFHPMRNKEDEKSREWVRSHNTLCQWLCSLEAMLYSLTYGLGELNYCAECNVNTN